MAINLLKHKDALIAAWKDVLDDNSDTDWALFGYEGMSNDLKFVSKGDGGLTELIDDLSNGKIQYAFLKVDVPNGSISKYVLINWQGEGAPTIRKGTCANHIKDVAKFFCGSHVTMHARTEDDLDENNIQEKLSKAGSAFNFKSSRGIDDLPPSGPIGTAYRKVNPVQEINSKERDQFWIKEEEEEKKRVDAEKKRKDEDKKKSDDEVKRRDQLEAAKRAEKDQEKRNGQSPGIATDLNSSEVQRRQRSQEAKQLIGTSTAAARALFTQHSAQGQVSTHNRLLSATPEKPARTSVVAQRIDSFTQGQPAARPASTVRVPTGPPDTLRERPLEQPKTSPLKNIDKIKMSLESPSQIQHEPIIDPADLSPSTETGAHSFGSSEGAVATNEASEPSDFFEPMLKQNVLDSDLADASYASSNENDDDDSDDKFSTIKRSPHSKSDLAEPLPRQDTVVLNLDYKPDDSGRGAEEEGVVYEDLDDDPGLTARALYDYQAADESEISFDPGDVITHIEQIDAGWWQGLGPSHDFGLFPANYVELMPHSPLSPP